MIETEDEGMQDDEMGCRDEGMRGDRGNQPSAGGWLGLVYPHIICYPQFQLYRHVRLNLPHLHYQTGWIGGFSLLLGCIIRLLKAQVNIVADRF